MQLNLDFIGIGAQKSATTWLNAMFESHYQVWVPPVKELQFFNQYFMPDSFKWADEHRKVHSLNVLKYQLEQEKQDWNRIRCTSHIADQPINFDWYNDIFSYAPEKSIKGEITPEYSLLPEKYVEKLCIANPNLKVIFIMREPFQRAISAVKMNLSKKLNSRELKKNDVELVAESEFSTWDVVERGNYQKIISIWKKHLKKGNLLMIDYEEIKHEPQKVLKLVTTFLNIDVSGFKSNPNEVVHRGVKVTFSKKLLDKVQPQYELLSDYYKNINEFGII